MQRFIGFIVSSVLVLLASSCQPVEKKITVLTTTDVHGAFFPSDAITGQTLPGSLAHISKYVNEQREKTDHEVLLLDNLSELYFSEFVKRVKSVLNKKETLLWIKKMRKIGVLETLKGPTK